MFDLMPRLFSRLGRGLIFLYNILSTFLTLFELFWSPAILNNIVNKTNRYATTPNPLDRTRKGRDWEQLTVGGLKAFMAVALFMGMKKQPNHKTY